ncbi:MAG: extracellular solute-binding protein [Chloroflexi bacterium]|nr:extracellular solute-binding protein [Chloroflexota bacterium]
MKMMNGLWAKLMASLFVLTLLAGLVTAGCASTPTPAPVTTPGAPAAVAPGVPTWQQEWESAVAEAKKEGSVVVWTAAGSDARAEMGKAFRDKTGIATEWVAGRTEETFFKIQRERQAGIFSVDAYYGSPYSPVRLFMPAGIVAPLPPLLLPEVRDPKVWYGGEFPFVDREKKHIFAGALYPNQNILVNSDLVKPGEINSYQDLLNPRWKGKMAMNDPATGVGGGWFHAVLYAKTLDLDFMRGLTKQEPVLSRDLRLTAEWVARGKYLVLVPPQPTAAAEFFDIGAPISYVMPKEGTYLTSIMGTVAQFDRAPHPKATQVFVNWFLSKEGQKLVSKLGLIESARVDLDVDIPPYLKRQPGVKYYVGAESEEALAETYPKNLELARQMFAHLVK